MADATSNLKVNVITNGVDQATASFGKLAGAFAIGSQASALFSEAMHKAVGFLESSLAAAEHQQNAVAQLNTVLQSTGRYSEAASKDLQDYAMSLEQTTTSHHTATEAIEATLLGFQQLSGPVVKQATQAVLDLSTRLGVDASMGALRLGEALENPATAAMKLRAVGVQLTQSQDEMAKKFVASGQTAKAQQVILNALSGSYGGAAAAAAKTLGGQVQQLGNAFTTVKDKIGTVIGGALQPFIQMALSFIQNNGNLVASLLAGAAAAAITAGAVIALGSAFLLATALGGPLTLILILISSLAGVVVFNAMQKLQQKFKDTVGTIGTGSKNIGAAADGGMGQAAKAAADLKKKLQEIDDQIAKSERDFRESMAKIVQDHEKKVNDLKAQLDDENKSFTDSQAKLNEDFQHSQDDQKDSHQQKVDDIQAQIDVEVKKGIWANKATLADLQKRLDQENVSYKKATDWANLQYQEDTANALDQHTKKANDLQAQLDQEKAFLDKHNADVQASNNVFLLDEIDSLKRTHSEELASFQKQKADAIANANQTTAGINSALGGIGAGLNPNALKGVGGQMGDGMARALKDAVIGAVEQLPGQIWWVLTQWKPPKLSSAFGEIGQLLHGLHVPGFASGVTNFGGGMAMVGENGPELVELPAGSNVIPNSKVANHSTDKSQVFNITINGDFSGSGGPQNLADILTHQLKMAGRY